MLAKLSNVKSINGTNYFCKKVRGIQHYVPLPDTNHPTFAESYLKAKTSFAKSANDEVAKGTWSALIAEYRTTPDYRQGLSASTKLDYDRYLDAIEKKLGAKKVAGVKVRHIEKMRDAMQDTPGKANNWLKVIRTILDLGVRREYCATNAAEKVTMLETGEHAPWPQAVLDHMLEKAPPITRLAILTGLYSGQRISDCIRITHKMMESEIMELQQHKKRSKGQRVITVYIPIHPGWRDAVAAVERRADTILYDRSGYPFTDTGALQERIRDLMKKLGYVDAKGQALYTFHGLRKNSSNYLAEMGLSPHQIGAINGMSIETVTHYTKNVTKKKLAQAASDRMLSSDPSKGRG